MWRATINFLADRFGKKPSEEELPTGLSSELPEATFQKIMGEINFLFPNYEPCTVSSGNAAAFLTAVRKIVVSHNIHPVTYKLKCIERGQHLVAMRTAALAKDNKIV
jgi:hypothetical protein